MPLREGRLVLDAHTLTPLEHRSEGLVETFSQYVEVGAGHLVPLWIRVEQQSMTFDWTFNLFEPGLWLLASARGDDRRGDSAVVDRVRVNGADARPIAEGRRPAVQP
jgi:hypothetical protein